MASTLALSSFPTLGSFQQCGQLLRGECQDGSTLSVLPCLRALPQGLQGEGPIAGAISAHPCATRVQLRLPYQLERGPAQAASVPQDMAHNPRPEKQERPAGSDTRTAVFRLVPPPPSAHPSLLHPRTASPCFHHTTHTSWDCSLPGFMGIWDLRKCATQGLLSKCVSVCLPLTWRNCRTFRKMDFWWCTKGQNLGKDSNSSYSGSYLETEA